MHPALALHLQEWRKETLYSKEADWVFASVREKGRIPLAASTAAKKHLRPAAVTAGVIVAGESTRFGWGNLRHSLATWMASNVDLKTAQSALRHSKISTIAESLQPSGSPESGCGPR
jgi:integrase